MVCALKVKPWYQGDHAAIAGIREEVEEAYPDLAWLPDADPPRFRGPFRIVEDGEVFAEYSLEVALPGDTPRGIPEVFEVAGTIPRNADRHVNANGSLCVVLPDAYWLHCPTGLSLVEFLKGPLRAHLAGQALAAMGKPWPVGEWAHGDDGIAEFYSRELQVTERGQLAMVLSLALKPRPPRQRVCPCGSGEKLRRCHGQHVDRLRARVPAHLLERAVAGLLSGMQGRKTVSPEALS